VKDLTPRQRDVFLFIKEYTASHMRPPAIREIAAAFGFASTNGVSQHLDALERKGYIRRRPFISRGIEILTEETDSSPGWIFSPGEPLRPLPPEKSCGMVSSPVASVRLFRVEGNAAAKEGIRHGDKLLVDAKAVPEKGDLVVCLHRGRAFLARSTSKGKTSFPHLTFIHGPRGFSPPPGEVKVLGVITSLTRQYREPPPSL